MTGGRDDVVSAIRGAVATLNPGYFALVMGTGIISVAMHVNSQTLISAVLFVIAVVAWMVLAVVYCWRALRCWPRLRADFTDARSGFGFFTFVAATNVLGVRFAFAGNLSVALVWLAIGALSWLILG